MSDRHLRTPEKPHAPTVSEEIVRSVATKTAAVLLATTGLVRHRIAGRRTRPAEPTPAVTVAYADTPISAASHGSQVGKAASVVTYTLADASGKQLGDVVVCRSVDGVGDPCASCLGTDGPFTCNANGTNITTLDPAGTVHHRR